MGLGEAQAAGVERLIAIRIAAGERRSSGDFRAKRTGGKVFERRSARQYGGDLEGCGCGEHGRFFRVSREGVSRAARLLEISRLGEGAKTRSGGR